MEGKKIGTAIIKLITILIFILVVGIFRANSVQASSTLTINPNNGKWQGSSTVQNYTQEKNTTKEISNPTGPKGCTVSFDYNGGTGSVTSLIQSGTQEFESWNYTFGDKKGTMTANYSGNPIILPEATKDEYKCIGWYTSIEAGTRAGAMGEGYIPEENITLYARWEKEPQHTIIYYANGGTGAPEKQTKVYGKTLRLSADIPIKDGYIFKGWTTNYETGIVEYSPNSKYSKEEDLTLYAVWTTTQELEINPNGGIWQGVGEIQSFTGETGTTKYIPNSEAVGGIDVNFNYNGGMADGTNFINANTGQFDGWTLKVGEGKNTLTAKYAEGAIILPGASYTGYSFKGWYTSETGGTRVGGEGDSYIPTAEITLYARWQQATSYVITYDANGGTGGPTSQTKEIGKTITLSTLKPTRTGYTFGGWGVNIDGKISTYQAGASYNIDGDKIFYAKWETAEYNIIYDANGGSGAPEKQIKVAGVPLEIRYETPIKEGSYFKGWATKSDSTEVEYNIGDKYTKDESIRLYAVWANTMQTLIINPGEGLLDGETGIRTYKKEINSTQNVNNPESSKNVTVTFDTEGGVTEQSVGYASNQFDGWKLKFGKEEMALDAIFGNNFIVLPACEKDGYNLDGWYTDPEGGTKVGEEGEEYVPSDNETLYAHWEEKTFEIKYNANGGTGEPATQIKVTGEKIKLSEVVPIREGYTFSGWNTIAAGTYSEYDAGAEYSLDQEQTLYAVWTPLTYEVIFDANGGDGEPPSQIKTYGKELELTGIFPIKTGYQFKGWSINAHSTIGEFQAGGTYTLEGNRTLYAVWGEVTYEIIYDANGGSGAPGKQIKQQGSSITLTNSTPYRSGYTFEGWSTNASDINAEYLSGEIYVLDESKTLYAVWQEEVIITYQVRFETNGGEGTPSEQTKIKGTPLIITSQKPSKVGHIFNGWSINPSSDVGEYQSGGKYTKDENVTLYAIWKGETYTIIYSANGGDGAPDKQTKSYGESIEITRNEPSRSGYTFMGWSTSSSATMTQYKSGQSYSRNENISLFAVWQKNTSSAKIDIGPNIESSTQTAGYDLKYTYGLGYIDNINVGLKRRKEIDIELAMNLQQVELIINNKSQKYTSGFSDISMYDSDIYQTTILEDRQLKAILKYKVTIKNNTPDFKVRVNELVNYFNSGLKVNDIYSETGTKYNYTTISKYGAGVSYSGYTNNYINEEFILNANESTTFYLELLADRNYISSNLAKNTNNIIEINSVTTFHPNPKYVYYPGVDKDSMPGTAVPGNTSTYEDDTSSSAMVFNKKGIVRNATGKVFVDSTPEEFQSGKERKGDGIYKNGEQVVPGVTTILQEISGTGLEYETTTNNNGEFTLLGYIPGNYIIKYIYGDDPYNTYDFKSTLYSNDRYTSKYWYTNIGTRYSDAVDSWDIRKEIDNGRETMMTATTAELSIEVETPKMSEMDFGIAERARDKISLNKEISNIRITLSNGTILLNGNPSEIKLPNTKYVKPQLRTEEDRLNRTNIFAKGTIWTEMDKEYMQGASIEIQYKINAKNIGEIDYYTEDYYKYYIKGTDSQQIKTSIDSIVDYVDNNLKYEDANNNGWDEISNERKRMLDSETKDYYNTIVYTEALKKNLEVLEESEDMYITLTQMISSETEEMEYENIAEIFSASSTRGYTRFSDILVKNFNPNKTVLETDECEADEVIITTPTGENIVLPRIIIIISFTTTIIGGLVAIYIIRKKVAN